MAERKFWAKPIENRLDETDIRVLGMLAEDSGFSNEELETIAKKAEMTKKEVRERIKVLKKKNIILKERISLIDMLKIWDYHLVEVVKAKIQTPVEELEVKTPIGWTGLMDALTNSIKKYNTNMVRTAFTLHGTEWDMLLMYTVNAHQDYDEFTEYLVEQGWVEGSWTIGLSEETKNYIFDPIAVPKLKDYKNMVQEPLLHGGGQVWKKAIENKLDEDDIKLLNILASDTEFNKNMYEKIAKESKISENEIKKRLNKLKERKIVLRDRISCIDIFRIWDYCFITFIRTMDKERLLADIKKTHGKLKLDIIRLASIISGYDWDLMLFTCTNKISEFEKFITSILKRHGVTRVWTVRPLESSGWFFDPIAVPNTEEYDKRVKSILSDYLLSEVN